MEYIVFCYTPCGKSHVVKCESYMEATNYVEVRSFGKAITNDGFNFEAEGIVWHKMVINKLE